MKTKKAQSEIITTVLIILLVLAAIVIVWQVVQGTIKKGGETVTSQSECMGLTLDLTYNSDDKTVNVKSNKAIGGFRVYEGGAQVGTGDGTAIGPFETKKSDALTKTGTFEVTSAGLVGTQWCEGLNKIEVTIATPPA